MSLSAAALPTVSIIVPTHDRPNQLSECLAAIAAIDYPRELLEVVVVDDGSADPLDAAVAPFRAEIELKLLRQAQAGPAAARNLGAGAARGSLLAFTDDDCLPDPGWLRALAVSLRDGVGAIGGATLNTSPESLFAAASQAILDWAYAFYNDGPDGPRFFASNNLAVPRALFVEIGGFDASFITSEDRELCDRLRHRGWRLVYAGSARVTHASEQSLAKFVKRHFGYGRGAYRFHAIRRERRSGSLIGDSSFHLQLPRRMAALAAAAGPRRAIGLAGVLVLWQLANAAGFFWEGLGARRSSPRLKP